MPTDNERREVARRLRELDYSDLQESLICAYLDALGIKGYEDWIGIAHRLADLIEPSETKVRCVAEVKVDGERLEKLGHDAAVELTGIDRDARFAHGIATAVRCRDCASIKPTTDGRRYCKLWSRIVPLDGYCWRGEAKSGEEAQEG